MIKELTIIANELDSRGLTKEADIVDGVIKSSSYDQFFDGPGSHLNYEKLYGLTRQDQPGADPGPETGIFTAGDDQFDVRRINFEGMDKDAILNILWNSIKYNNLVTKDEITTIENDWGIASSMEDLPLAGSVKNIDMFSRQVKHNYDNDRFSSPSSPSWAAEEILQNLELTKVRRDIGEELMVDDRESE